MPAQRVSVIEHGVLKALLMSRTPRKEIAHSNGHARAPRFASPHVHIGNLVVSSNARAGAQGAARALEKTAKSGGVETYVVRLLEEDTIPGGDADDMMSLLQFGLGGAADRRRCARWWSIGWRMARRSWCAGLMLEGLLPRSLKEITAVGRGADGLQLHGFGWGGSGVPSSIVTPPLLFSDVDIRRADREKPQAAALPRPVTPRFGVSRSLGMR